MANDIPSRLTHRASGAPPTRGLGSGFADNQRIAGASNPVLAAQMAGASPADVQEAMDVAETSQRESVYVRDELVQLATSDTWTPHGITPPSGTTWEQFYKMANAEHLKAWYDEYLALREQVEVQSDKKLIEDSLSQNYAEDLNYNGMYDDKRRKAIESGLEPLDFEQMVFSNQCSQVIPVRPNLTITLCTVSTQQQTWVGAWASKFSDVNPQTLRHQFSLALLACSLKAVNGQLADSDLSRYKKSAQRADFLTALEKKLDWLGEKPANFTDDWIIQMVWFQSRVRRLMQGNLVERVGNS